MLDIDVYSKFINQKINHISLSDSYLELHFKHGILVLSDDKHLCCEYRYLTCDDDLQYYVGSYLYNIETRDGGAEDNTKGLNETSEPFCNSHHEKMFLLITTSNGVFTICAHNKSNGYYTGFEINASIR